MSNEKAGSLTLENVDQQTPGYTKQQYLESERYLDQKDLIAALLEDAETYSPEQVEQIITEFLQKEAE